MRTFEIATTIRPAPLVVPRDGGDFESYFPPMLLVARFTGAFNAEPFAGIAARFIRFMGAEGRPLEGPLIRTINHFELYDEPMTQPVIDGVPVPVYSLKDLWQIPGIDQLDRRDVREMVLKQIEGR